VRRLAVIVLAAGRSSRFATAGAHKLLASIEGAPLVRMSVKAALDAEVGDVVVVTGAEADAVATALHGLPVRVVHAAAFAEGMATSLRCGIGAVERDTDAALIALGDQPTVRPEAYRRVVVGWRSTGAAIVLPRHGTASDPAHPVLFAAETYRELLTLRGDVGARAVIAADPGRVLRVDLDWPAPRDIDTSEDLGALLAEFRAARRGTPDDARHETDSPLGTEAPDER